MAGKQAMSQYALELAAPATYSAENFVLSGCNRDAAAWILAWPEWNAHAMIVSGPAASGKTHLAHMWQEKSKAYWLSPAELTAGDIPNLLANTRAAVLEQADAVPAAETLLHLVNYARENNVSLLLTSSLAPKAWPYLLPDLTSRLNALPQAVLEAPDDELLSALLVKLFSDRGISVDTSVIGFLISRIERSFEAAKETVDALDALSLAQKRPITLPLARQLLNST